MSYKQASIAIIHDANNPNYVLMLRRALDDFIAPGMFCFPGGKLDDGESFKDACIREVYEETGYKLSPDHMVHYDTVIMGEYEVAVFRAWKYKSTTSAPKLSNEHIDWARYNVNSLISVESDKVAAETVKVYNKYAKTFTNSRDFRFHVYPGIIVIYM